MYLENWNIIKRLLQKFFVYYLHNAEFVYLPAKKFSSFNQNTNFQMDAEDHIELWKKFKSGDWAAYTSLYTIFFGTLNNYGVKFSPDPSLIEDAVHDLYVKLWTSRNNLGDPVSVKNYLFKSFRNILFRKMKVQHRFARLDTIEDAENFVVSFTTASSTAENKDLRSKMISFIKGLAPRQQEIIFLRFYEGFSYDEIAEIMSIEVSSAYKLLYKALESLQNVLGPGTLVFLLHFVPKF